MSHGIWERKQRKRERFVELRRYEKFAISSQRTDIVYLGLTKQSLTFWRKLNALGKSWIRYSLYKGLH
jgi:hypothetical protein